VFATIHLSLRWAGPLFIPLGGLSIYPAWWAQYLSRLVGSVFIPLGGISIYPAWWAQYLSRLASSAFTPLGGRCRKKKTGILVDACVQCG